MEKDWIFRTDEYICDLRTVGVLVRNGKLLVQRDRDGSEYALPGGHVKIGETTEDGLVREYKEAVSIGKKLTAIDLTLFEQRNDYLSIIRSFALQIGFTQSKTVNGSTLYSHAMIWASTIIPITQASCSVFGIFLLRVSSHSLSRVFIFILSLALRELNCDSTVL